MLSPSVEYCQVLCVVRYSFVLSCNAVCFEVLLCVFRYCRVLSPSVMFCQVVLCVFR